MPKRSARPATCERALHAYGTTGWNMPAGGACVPAQRLSQPRERRSYIENMSDRATLPHALPHRLLVDRHDPHGQGLPTYLLVDRHDPHGQGLPTYLAPLETSQWF